MGIRTAGPACGIGDIWIVISDEVWDGAVQPQALDPAISDYEGAEMQTHIARQRSVAKAD